MKRVKISLAALAIVFGAASAFTTKTKMPTDNCPTSTTAYLQQHCPQPFDVTCCKTTANVIVNGVPYLSGADIPGTFTP